MRRLAPGIVPLVLQLQLRARAIHARTVEHALSQVAATSVTVWKDGPVLSALRVSSKACYNLHGCNLKQVVKIQKGDAC